MPRNELFIGNLDRHVTQRDIESVFDKYGKILRCDVKNRGEAIFYKEIMILKKQFNIYFL